MLISTYFNEATGGAARAEVYKNEAGGYYYIDYFDFAGNKLKTEAHVGKSLRFVEDTAENWTAGIKVLNG